MAVARRDRLDSYRLPLRSTSSTPCATPGGRGVARGGRRYGTGWPREDRDEHDALGCAPDTAADEAVVFHGSPGLIFHSRSTLDETAILEAAAVASVDGVLLAWAEQCLQVGASVHRRLAGKGGSQGTAVAIRWLGRAGPQHHR